eukprot:373719_1
MPKMDEKKEDDNEKKEDDDGNKEEKKEDEPKLPKATYSADVLKFVFGDSTIDEESDLFDSKARADWEWVGIGGHGVVRVDYHSPFTIGWDRCRPRAHLGTDVVGDANAGDEPPA